MEITKINDYNACFKHWNKYKSKTVYLYLWLYYLNYQKIVVHMKESEQMESGIKKKEIFENG